MDADLRLRVTHFEFNAPFPELILVESLHFGLEIVVAEITLKRSDVKLNVVRDWCSPSKWY